MRVISGRFGGRRLAAPRGRSTRPTSDRVREALFMALEPLHGVKVVDLFAGSGALGIEALSRGAVRVDFVEHGRDALRTLSANLAAFGIDDEATIWRARLPQGLKRLGERLAEADLILADPPYGGADARVLLEHLGAPGVLGPRARLVIEHHGKDVLPDASGVLRRVRTRRYGETDISTYVPLADGASAAGEEHGA